MIEGTAAALSASVGGSTVVVAAAGGGGAAAAHPGNATPTSFDSQQGSATSDMDGIEWDDESVRGKIIRFSFLIL